MLKVVCHGRSNLISCLDDIIVTELCCDLIGQHWSVPSVEPAGLYTKCDLQVLGCTRHRSGCPISL